jgi:hypothetical protein
MIRIDLSFIFSFLTIPGSGIGSSHGRCKSFGAASNTLLLTTN